jgi:hypothetical protein
LATSGLPCTRSTIKKWLKSRTKLELDHQVGSMENSVSAS